MKPTKNKAQSTPSTPGAPSPVAPKPKAKAKPAGAKKKTTAPTEAKAVIAPAKVAPPVVPPAAAKPAVEPVKPLMPAVPEAPAKPEAPQVAAGPAPGAATAAPAPKPVSALPPATVIAVNVDVGFGNSLFVRGEGPGLSWDKGEPAECVADDLWQFEVRNARGPVAFKVLVNDTVWSTGENYTASPGAKLTLTPSF